VTTFVFLLALLFQPVVPSESAPAKSVHDVVRAIETRYRAARTLKAKFYESYADGKGGISAESGVVYFSKPGRMRWEYESPQEKLFIVDGTNVWFYIPADRTATRAKIGESADWRTPLAFLTGKTDLGRLCRSIEFVEPKPEGKLENPSPSGNVALRCAPRVNSGDTGDQIKDVVLEANADAYLTRILVEQPGNLTTEFRFGSWEENLPVAETKFHFVPPSGVSVVDEATLAGALR
jgi:outer membrane lipoprotein carrier protein